MWRSRLICTGERWRRAPRRPRCCARGDVRRRCGDRSLLRSTRHGRTSERQRSARSGSRWVGTGRCGWPSSPGPRFPRSLRPPSSTPPVPVTSQPAAPRSSSISQIQIPSSVLLVRLARNVNCAPLVVMSSFIAIRVLATGSSSGTGPTPTTPARPVLRGDGRWSSSTGNSRLDCHSESLLHHWRSVWRTVRPWGSLPDSDSSLKRGAAGMRGQA